jgi:hypothetical protein
MISLPTSQKWNILQSSDLFGDLVATKNMDFDLDGYAALARKGNTLLSSNITSVLGLPIVTVNDGSYYYIFNGASGGGTGGIVIYDFNNIGSFSAFTISGGSTPFFDLASDAVVFNGLVTVTAQLGGTYNLYTYSGGLGGAFTSRVTTLSFNYPHPLCVMENRQTILVADGNVVSQYSTAYAYDSTNQLTLPKDHIVTWMRYRASNVYIGTRNITGGEAKMFVWNGTGTAFQTAYGVGANWAYSGIEYNSSIAVITSAGRLLRFNGGGFDELAILPVYVSPYAWTSKASTASLIGKVANRGMAVSGDFLYVNLDGSLDILPNENPGAYLEGQPSGVWVYDPTVGFYHKTGLSSDPMLHLTPTSVASNNLVFATPHQATTGDAVVVEYAGTLTGISVGQTYYAIVQGAYALGLALTPAGALAGRSIQLGGTISTDTFAFTTHSQEGSSLIITPGMIFPVGTPHINNFYGSDVLFGGVVTDSNNTSRAVMGSLGSGKTVGYMVSPKIYSSQITDDLQKVITKFADINLASDQITVKYRTNTRFSLPTNPATGTWTSATTMTCDSSQDINNLQVGDELEFLSGANAGYMATITAITKPSSIYTFTFDAAYNYASGYVSTFIGNNWKKLNVIDNQSPTTNFGEFTVGVQTTWYQIKVILSGYRLSILQLKLINSILKSST